jgi:hypothetical protein
MNASSNFSFLIQQLLYSAPSLVAYAVGIVLALTFMRRHPRPATLTLIGCALLFFTSLGRTLAMSYFMDQLRSGGMTSASYGGMASAVSLVTALIYAGSFGLLLAAVFTGRSGELAGFPVSYASYPVTPPPYPPTNG